MNIYNTLYELINTYVYGGSIVAESVADLVATLISTAGCIFLIAVPFMLVWRICKLLMGR